MAYAESQPTISLVAETTFAKTDLYKFVELSTVGRVSIGASTSAASVVGTLLSQTYSTSTGANETVQVGLLSGVGKVYMAGSTEHIGKAISASSAGFGVTPTTDALHIGWIVDGSSGTTGRIASVMFSGTYNV